jgi:ABC-type multidrug transport system fused ATPase/permease subunit
MASLNLIESSTTSFFDRLMVFQFESMTYSKTLQEIRKFYDLERIQNTVVDGDTPYPENSQALHHGVSLEFRCPQSVCFLMGWLTPHRNVSFKYPGADMYAVRNVSFKVEAGELCVGLILALA